MKITEAVLNFLFPPKCIFCSRLLWRGDGDAKYVCHMCRNELPYTSLSTCETKGNYFSVCVSPFFYRDHVRNAILRLKFSRNENLARPMGHYIAGCISTLQTANRIQTEFDIVTWVPLSRKRKNRRGFDQACLLAEQVSKELSISFARCLKKIKHTTAQSTLKGSEERRSNISGAYRVNSTSDLSGKKILLIDDVITTGSTLSECSRILIEAGAESVTCATFAKAGE